MHNFQTDSPLNFHWTFVSCQSKRCLLSAIFTCPECKSPPMLRPLDFVFPVPAPGLRVNTALFMKRRERMFLFIFYDADQIQCRIFRNSLIFLLWLIWNMNLKLERRCVSRTVGQFVVIVNGWFTILIQMIGQQISSSQLPQPTCSWKTSRYMSVGEPD